MKITISPIVVLAICWLNCSNSSTDKPFVKKSFDTKYGTIVVHRAKANDNRSIIHEYTAVSLFKDEKHIFTNKKIELYPSCPIYGTWIIDKYIFIFYKGGSGGHASLARYKIDNSKILYDSGFELEKYPYFDYKQKLPDNYYPSHGWIEIDNDILKYTYDLEFSGKDLNGPHSGGKNIVHYKYTGDGNFKIMSYKNKN